MDLTKILKQRNDSDTARLLKVSPTMIGQYKKGIIPRYKQIEKFKEITKGKINFSIWFGKNNIKIINK